jgi:3-oxoacyl-[acyl-carrier protein] reductase
MSASAPKHVLITGGSRGIGLSIAHLFASQPTPHRCTLVSRNALRLSTAVSTLPASPTGAHATIPGDISAASFWTAAGIGAALGNPPQNAVDVLVNCAGVSQARGFVAMGHEELEEVVGTNLTGMMMGTRFLLRKRYIRGSSASSSRKRGDGEGAQEHGEAERNVTTSSPVIINISSLLGVKGGRGAVAYAASKAGVLGMAILSIFLAKRDMGWD